MVTLKDGIKLYLQGKDHQLYVDNDNDSQFTELVYKLYRVNYIVCALLILLGILFSAAYSILLFSCLWV